MSTHAYQGFIAWATLPVSVPSKQQQVFKCGYKPWINKQLEGNISTECGPCSAFPLSLYMAPSSFFFWMAPTPARRRILIDYMEWVRSDACCPWCARRAPSVPRSRRDSPCSSNRNWNGKSRRLYRQRLHGYRGCVTSLSRSWEQGFQITQPWSNLSDIDATIFIGF